MLPAHNKGLFESFLNLVEIPLPLRAPGDLMQAEDLYMAAQDQRRRSIRPPHLESSSNPGPAVLSKTHASAQLLLVSMKEVSE